MKPLEGRPKPEDVVSSAAVPVTSSHLPCVPRRRCCCLKLPNTWSIQYYWCRLEMLSHFYPDNNPMKSIFQFPHWQMRDLMLWEVKFPKVGKVINGRGRIWLQVFKIPDHVHHSPLYYLRHLHFTWSHVFDHKGHGILSTKAGWGGESHPSLNQLPWTSRS